ncbi:DUF4186 domain-containing protein [Escherichia coli]|nr:DUF4186 domain-containing protein [Escherichia coli]
MQSLGIHSSRVYPVQNFASAFVLGVKERQYCLEKGAPALNNIRRILSLNATCSALPANDGKQNPMRGHPVLSLNATATCCRGCLNKGITFLREALVEQQRYIVTVIYHWLVIQ